MSTDAYHLKSSVPLVNLTPGNLRNFHAKLIKSGPLPDQSNPHYVGLDRCWEWAGSKDYKGYGRLRCGDRATGAHRVAYFLKNGEPPVDRPCILHRCDNPACCNPNHLFVGTHVENMADKHQKIRANTKSGDNHYANLDPKPRRCGELNGLAKLTDEKVLEIRRLYAEGVIYKEIAAMFGVNISSIAAVVTRKTWKHIP